MHIIRSGVRLIWLSTVVWALLAGCGAPVSTASASLGSLQTSALEQWPPVSNRGPAPGVSIVLRDRTAVLTNDSEKSYWLSPPIIELWEGGAPWVVIVDPGVGTLEVKPGDEVELAIGNRADTVRVGARLWPNADPDQSVEAWFNWLEVAGTD
jgi:hypothetical protein